jgi:hypothetical protein
MNRARHVIALALILLFGPAPVMSLLAQVDEPQCQMACCKRAALGQACPLHHGAASESSGQGVHAVPHCASGCSQVAGAPSAFAVGCVQSSGDFFVPQITTSVYAVRSFGVRWILDSFLHQRPPPSVSA